MKILFLSYSDIRYDGRLRELLAVADELGEVSSVIKYNRKEDEYNCSLTASGFAGIREFIKKAKDIAKKMQRVDILFVDNRMACIPGLKLKKKLKRAFVIQDVRELYLLKEQTRVKSKIGCLIEKKMIEKSDVIICANKYRAQKMMEVYSLKRQPVVYENIRKLDYGVNVDIEEYREKYKDLFAGETINIISTSGYDISRTNDLLVKSLKKVNEKVKLFMVGGGTNEDRIKIEKIIAKEKLNNIYLIDKVGEAELKYLISKCQIGIVNYGQYDTNNQLCASGKIFEFLFEGIPVVTTGNLPLKEFCEKYQIGVAGDLYSNNLKKVISNYEVYKKNVTEFSKRYNVKQNNLDLIKKLKGLIDKGTLYDKKQM